MTTLPPKPPWIEYPDEEPWWGGWRQGTSEAWLLRTWLPFWQALGDTAKEEYLQRWPPPTEDWRIQVTVYWK
ncbi:hypothetical protein [Corallococcus sicarius]|uniref:Uncharacterized protein n=1 Tax=Corallococcus sicarius TaxID=2316726 RepID=A0A3A8N739_9BACT|nr:hypothetical protein [Corallococcus sicarius]RKH39309.1 hypothetical protein D7X12_23930 [Corallococcus sicarius]